MCAYVIEQLDYGPAVAALENNLKADPGDSGHFWGPVFAVRALLVLKGIPDPSGGLADYDDSTIQTAIWGPGGLCAGALTSREGRRKDCRAKEGQRYPSV